MTHRLQDFPKILLISSCSRTWWKTNNWCLMVTAGRMGVGLWPMLFVPPPSDPLRSLLPVLCVQPPAKSSASVTKYWRGFSPYRELSVSGNFIVPMAILPPTPLPFPLPWGQWLTDSGAQKPNFLTSRKDLLSGIVYTPKLLSRSHRGWDFTWSHTCSLPPFPWPPPISLPVSPRRLSLINPLCLNPWPRIHF